MLGESNCGRAVCAGFSGLQRLLESAVALVTALAKRFGPDDVRRAKCRVGRRKAQGGLQLVVEVMARRCV